MPYPEIRPRRLRRNAACGGWSPRPASTRPSWSCRCSSRGLTEPRQIASLPGCSSTPGLPAQGRRGGGPGRVAGSCSSACRSPGRDRSAGSTRGHPQRRIRDVVAEVGDATVVMSDLCLDEFTSHGHCGCSPRRRGDNDATLTAYAEMAWPRPTPGPRGRAVRMMDVRWAWSAGLDAAGHQDVAVLAYAVKYASAFFGRSGRGGVVPGGRPAQLPADPANLRESLREVELDVAEGADMVMVKPALPYLDVVSAVRAAVDVPVAAYQVSGEYAMVEAAAANGWIDRERVILETLTSIRRAGAQIILTYWAVEAAQLLRQRY
ncbi:porphobilinogen synthase [Micromonospora siamensis]|uniref:porphobilinogen synthase n=1 Tax=Micromonospora siamensis TaxID=299152 RepID=UPI0022B26617|nr:porphobilinogen synthase [Micromonospora siamensis]